MKTQAAVLIAIDDAFASARAPLRRRRPSGSRHPSEFRRVEMTWRQLKLMIPILTLAVTLASGAGAATKTKKHHNQMTAQVASSSPTCRGAGNFRCGAVYDGNTGNYLGNDPDSFIRLMIQRDLGVKYGGED
jgi:hypothetical protein